MFFDNRPDAMAATVPATQDWVQLQGYTSPGDLGGGLYRRYGATPPPHQARFQSADGTWWELSEPVVRPEMLGAARDGATDDSVALNDALALGRPVQLTEGTYFVAATVQVARDGAELFGTRGSVVLADNALLIAISLEANRCKLRGFKLLGQRAGKYSPSHVGVRCLRDPNAVVFREDLVVEGLEVTGFGTSGIRLDLVQRSRVAGNYVHHCGQHGIVLTVAQNNEVTGNVVTDISPGATNPATVATNQYHPAYGISIARDPSRNRANAPVSTGNLISGNTVLRVRGWVGIDSHGTYNTRILGNRVEECYVSIHMEDGDHIVNGQSAEAHPSLGVTVEGNELVGNGESTFYSYEDPVTGQTVTTSLRYGRGPAINLDGASAPPNESQRQVMFVIANNRIYRAGYSQYGSPSHSATPGAIRIRTAEAVVVTGNHVYNAYRHAIFIGDNSYGVTVCGNAIQNVVAVQDAVAVGVMVGHTLASAVIDGNLFVGASPMVGYKGVGGFTGDYGAALGTNKKFGTMALSGGGL